MNMQSASAMLIHESMWMIHENGKCDQIDEQIYQNSLRFFLGQQKCAWDIEIAKLDEWSGHECGYCAKDVNEGLDVCVCELCYHKSGND